MTTTHHLWRCDSCGTGSNTATATAAKTAADRHNQVKHGGGNEARPITYRL